MWSCVHLLWGWKPGSHIGGRPCGGNLHFQPVYIQCFFSSLAELPHQNAEQTACSHLSYEEPRREAAGILRAQGAPAVTLSMAKGRSWGSSSMQEEVLQDDLCSVGQKQTLHPAWSQPGCVPAEEGTAWPCRQRGGVAPCLGQPRRAWSLLCLKDSSWAAADGCYSHPDT